MRASFEQAGFVEPVARFEEIRTGDPFQTINRLGSAEEPYVILVHQDVLLDQGDGRETLERRLSDLTELDPSWCVAGNAGTTDKGFVGHINDPLAWWRITGPPVRVVSLDENFLVLRTARRPRASRDLNGFHLYGTDVCLHAEQDGSSCYLIEFLATHLSSGDRTGLVEAMDTFSARWSGFRPRYVRTSTGWLALGRPRLVRWVMRRGRVAGRLCKWEEDPGAKVIWLANG